MAPIRNLMIALALGGSGCGPRSEADLKQPTLELVTYGGFCSTEVVVDSSNAVWTEHGCENSSSGWHCVARIDAARRASLEALLDAGRPPSSPTCDRGTSSSRLYDAWRGVGGAGGGWTTCTDPNRTLTPGEQAFVDAMNELVK